MAVSTTPTLLTTSWQNLGTGPLQVQVSGGPAILAVSDTQPVAGGGGYWFNGGVTPYAFNTTSTIWGRVEQAGGKVVAQTSPVTAAGGGSGGSVTQGTTPWVVNVSQFGGNSVVTGTGASGAGVPRMTVANDSIVGAAQSGTWTVTANQGGAWTVAATQSGSWTVAQSGSWTVAATQSGAWNTNLYVGGAANASGNPAFVSVTNFPTSQPAYEQGSSLAAAGIAPVVTAAGTSAVGKASQGNLYSGYAVNATTTAGYLVAINAAAVPTAGAAITPVDVAYLAGTVGATASINYGAGPPNAYSTGIVLLVTTSLTTYTAGGNAFIQARVR